MNVVKVLEIGHGGVPMGRSVAAFAKILPSSVEYHGIEQPNTSNTYSEIAQRIVQAETHLPDLIRSNIRFHRMDATSLTFESGSFDEVHAHFFLSDPLVDSGLIRATIGESARVLKTGGYLILTGEVFFFSLEITEARDVVALGASVNAGLSLVLNSVFDAINPGILDGISTFSQYIAEFLDLRSFELLGGIQVLVFKKN